MSGSLLDSSHMGEEPTREKHIKEASLHTHRRSEPSYGWEAAKSTADDVLFKTTQQHLSDVECKVLEGAWLGKTYDQMAMEYGYSPEYLNKDVGNKLWRKLSAGLGERVGKRNFREALRRAWKETLERSSSIAPLKAAASNETEIPSSRPQIDNIPFPEGAVALSSPLYVLRNGVESCCHDAISQPGALLRIKAPALMGKTSLVNRILEQAKQHVGKVVYLDLTSCDRAFLSNLDKFLRRLCAIASQQLGLDNQLNDRWDTDILGSNDNCTAYFEDYLLPAVDGVLVVGIDECDRLFAYPDVAEDILGMLRSWHEKGKVSPLWERLRLVISHATDVYIPLDINQSPFNAGIPIELKPFEAAQIAQLAALHGLALSEQEVQRLMDTVGGHPYLIRLALYQLSTTDMDLASLLANADSDSGIYDAHLRSQLAKLQQDSTLLSAFHQVVSEGGAAVLTTTQEYKLHSTGLVRRESNGVVTSCQLYQTYFSRVLSRELAL
ncbi:MAG: AAA-like domain-containing protein [Cyanobacteria bacterium P01_D01_bin.105]